MSKSTTAGKEYVHLTLPELEALDKDKTICLITVSPIEAHGPHLPVGTDIFIAQELQRRYMKIINGHYPGFTCLTLPDLYCGSDALPVTGSLSVRATALEAVLLDYAQGLAKQGFKYLLVADNHGGPRHQMALYRASTRAWKRWRFAIIAPFNLVFRLMVHHDEEFLALTGLGPGECGDDADAHAGTNETALLLAVRPDLVKDTAVIAASLPPRPKGFAKLLYRVGAAFDQTSWGKDLKHLANTLAWISDEDMLAYMGDPKKGKTAAGEAMLNARIKAAEKMLDEVIKQGKEPARLAKPMLYWLHWLVKLPE